MRKLANITIAVLISLAVGFGSASTAWAAEAGTLTAADLAALGGIATNKTCQRANFGFERLHLAVGG